MNGVEILCPDDGNSYIVNPDEFLGIVNFSANCEDVSPFISSAAVTNTSAEPAFPKFPDTYSVGTALARVFGTGFETVVPTTLDTPLTALFNPFAPISAPTISPTTTETQKKENV